MSIECTTGPNATIYIRFDEDLAPEIFYKETFCLAVCQYLTDAGIIDLEERKILDFVVGVATGNAARHSADYKTSIPTYDQHTLYGRAYEEPAGIVRALEIVAKN